eukprot:1143354-Pelagomonas_calceolata.AAC.3
MQNSRKDSSMLDHPQVCNLLQLSFMLGNLPLRDAHHSMAFTGKGKCTHTRITLGLDLSLLQRALNAAEVCAMNGAQSLCLSIVSGCLKTWEYKNSVFALLLV